MKIDVLGTKYEIVKKDYQDTEFEKVGADGRCKFYERLIVCGNLSTFPGYENEPTKAIEEAEKHTLRHEIVHAFLNESGLQSSAGKYSDAWAYNEEMVDWIALQGLKIYEAWKKAGAV